MPRMLLPTPLSSFLPSHLPIYPANEGVYVEAPYPTLLKLYSHLSRLSDAIVFPEPERQLLLKKEPPYLAIPSHYASHPFKAAYTFLENVLFISGYARSLRKISNIPPSPSVLLPFLHFNLDDSSLSGRGNLLPSSLVKVEGYLDLYTLMGERIVIRKEGFLTLADALFHELPFHIENPIYTSSKPSFLHRSILEMIETAKSILKKDYLDDRHLNTLKTIQSILQGLPNLLLNTYVLGTLSHYTLQLSHSLLQRNPKIYNNLVEEWVTCYPALSEQGSYLLGLFKLLTEHLPS